MNNSALTIGLAMVLGMLAQVGVKTPWTTWNSSFIIIRNNIWPRCSKLDQTRVVRNRVTYTSWLCCGDNPFRGRNESPYKQDHAREKCNSRFNHSWSTVHLGWDFRTAILFGTLIIVTGPTVISPLLKKIRIHHGVSTILEAEGILLDAIGAIVAVLALEIAISPSGLSFVKGLYHIL